jgi:hypothetical protein
MVLSCEERAPTEERAAEQVSVGRQPALERIPDG